MVASLLSDLVERGLDADRMRLWVINGGKALRKAIVQTFGQRALIQRRQEHKRRNVLEHLPEDAHASVKRVLKDAWLVSDADPARKQLARLASSLQAKHSGAAASVREGLDETLTVRSLGITGSLYRTCARPIRSRTSTARWRAAAATSSVEVTAGWCCAGSPAHSATRPFANLGFALCKAFRQHSNLAACR